MANEKDMDIPSPFSDNALWIELLPKQVNYDVTNLFKLGSQLETFPTGDEVIRLIAPEEIQDNLTHNWEPLENIASRLANIGAKALQEGKMSTERHKVDTALLYTDSNRREFTFVSQLAAYKNPKTEVLDVVNKLRKMSCPSLAAGLLTHVGNPTVFEVTTTPTSLITIKNAALTAVQPTFKGPYIQVGSSRYPSLCELSLTFKDLEPLSQNSIESDINIVTTSSTPLYY